MRIQFLHGGSAAVSYRSFFGNEKTEEYKGDIKVIPPEVSDLIFQYLPLEDNLKSLSSLREKKQCIIKNTKLNKYDICFGLMLHNIN